MEYARLLQDERLGGTPKDEKARGGRAAACGKRVYSMSGDFITTRYLDLFTKMQKNEVINIRSSEAMTQKNTGLANDSVCYWQDSVEVSEFSALKADLDVHVCIVAAGITGTIAAYP